MGTALVVEDSLTEREIITSYLRSEGITVLLAKNGEEAVEHLSGNTPDVIVLDVVLPGRSGFEICRDLKAEEKTSNIPVVICSTKNTEMDRFWGLKQGANAYLTKPLDEDEFRRTIKQLIK